MKRKVIQLAGKTLVVSLPSKWAQKAGIRKGDEVEVEEKGNQVVIGTEGGSETAKLRMELSGPEEFIRRRIGITYKQGFDEVEFSYDDPGTVKIVRKEAEKLMGFEIVSQAEHSCVVRNVMDEKQAEFDSILRRVFLMTLELADNSYEALLEREYFRLGEIGETESTNDRLTDLCKRILNKKGYPRSRKITFIYCIVWEIEKIVDEYAAICDGLAKKDKSFCLPKGLLDFYSEVNMYLREYYELFYKLDIERAKKFSKDRKLLEEKGAELVKRHKGEAGLVAHHLLALAGRIYSLASPYYAFAL